MVHYKRRALTTLDPPPVLSQDQEIWVMRGSNEVFTSYDKYLERYDFYLQRDFSDEVNRKSGMTFFEALESESVNAAGIDKTFPEHLRVPVLRKVQFSQIGRMEDLVSHVYEEFRSDFFPGEEVIVNLDDGATMEGVVREKANFPELRNPDGSVQRPAFSRYFVKIKTQEEALLDGGHMKRHRNAFTKVNLKLYLRNCLRRDAYNGAPWLVKEHLAAQHKLPMAIPLHLTRDAQLAQARAQAQSQRDSPVAKPSKKAKPAGPPPFSMDTLVQQDIDSQVKAENVKPEPIRFPLDDLDLPPKSDAPKRPQLKFIAPLDNSPDSETGLHMQSVGPLLEIWNALSVHWDIFELDAFTFDDFFNAMKYEIYDLSPPCEMFDEIHSGVLKMMVDKGGEVQVQMPSLGDESEDEEDSTVADESRQESPVENGLPNGRSRRSNLSFVQNSSDQHSGLEQHVARVLGGRDWITRLAAREFSDGGWQLIMLGLLHQLSLSPLYNIRLEPILQHLAPIDQPRVNVRDQYNTLDINHRITALALIIQLSMSTPQMKNHLEHRGEEMTVIRKQKVEAQRERKEHIRDLNAHELERRANNPDAFIDEEEKANEVDTPVLANGHVDDTLSTNGGLDDDDDETLRGPQRRAHQMRKRKREEEIARQREERLAQLEKEKDKADKVKKYKRILKDIDAAKKKIADCETRIEGFDEKLREMNNARMRAMGRDRFWGRWWWFERVGMPVDGSGGRRAKRQKVSHADGEDDPGYAMGRLWVQGPLDMEREGFIELNEEDAKSYALRHGMTVLERKAAEEGTEGVKSAEQWGYIDDPEDLDNLINWLDEKGRREKDLKKELMLWKEDVALQMGKLRAYLNPEKEEEDGPRNRVSTRHTKYYDPEDVSWRFMRWRNSRASVKGGRHCQHSSKVDTNGTNTKIKLPKRGKEKHPILEEVVIEDELKKAKGASGRAGAGGKGVAVKRVASQTAKEAIKGFAKEELDAERGGTRSTRSTRSTRASRGKEEEADEMEVDPEPALEPDPVEPVGVRTAASAGLVTEKQEQQNLMATKRTAKHRNTAREK
ncbi:ATP-utilizing chromatin assembly and remodelling N-terminal domain-containing protein [Elsinoe fawcettii]|nr:ATP-utilizing chromatin assembly and remodelling N-terminal domain-containing protein [Elsinoe fawcettii]